MLNKGRKKKKKERKMKRKVTLHCQGCQFSLGQRRVSASSLPAELTLIQYYLSLDIFNKPCCQRQPAQMHIIIVFGSMFC